MTPVDFLSDLFTNFILLHSYTLTQVCAHIAPSNFRDFEERKLETQVPNSQLGRI